MKKIISIIMVVVILLSACSSNEEKLYTIPSVPLESLDIVNISSAFSVSSNVYTGIYEVDKDSNLVLSGAKSVDVSEDGLTYTAKLKDDIAWVDSNGEEKGNVTAADYLFNYERILTPENKASMSYLFSGVIKGAKEMLNGEVQFDEVGIKALDDYTIEYTLNYPAPYFPGMLAFPTYYAQPKGAMEEYGDEYGTEAQYMWYSGPFYVSEFDSEYGVKMLKSEPYYDADMVQLPGLYYRVLNDDSAKTAAFENGEIDSYTTQDQNLYEQGINGQKPEDAMSALSYYIAPNLDSERPTSDENLRSALFYGFNRNDVTKGFSGDMHKPIEYFVPEGITGVTYDGLEYRDFTEDSLVTYDPELAKTYLQTYMDNNGINDASEITLDFLIFDSSEGNKIGEAVQAEYKNSLGINIDVTVLPENQYIDQRNEGEFDLSYRGWSADYADPSTYLDIFNSANIGTLNVPRFSDADFDQKLEAAAEVTDPEARMEAYASLETQLISEEHAIIPFYLKNKPNFITDQYKVYRHLFLLIPDKYTEVLY